MENTADDTEDTMNNAERIQIQQTIAQLDKTIETGERMIANWSYYFGSASQKGRKREQEVADAKRQREVLIRVLAS